MKTRIQLSTSGSIDLSEDVQISLNYSIADIREPEKRNASFSKTIVAPGSKTNNKIFTHIFEINIDSNFNPNLKAEASVYVDDIEVMKGYLRLLKIRKLEGGRVEYECNVTGNVGSVFIDMGDNYLSDLSFSEFNHTYNRTNQKASWTAAVGAGYVYPFIDYGTSTPSGMGVGDFFPAIYAKQYIDKICSTYGYSYTSNFLDSDLFKRLIIPYNGTGLRLTESQINSRLFNATIGSSGSITLNPVAGLYTDQYYTAIVPYNSETSDVSNQFNTSTYRFKSANVGMYKIEGQFNYQLNSTGNAFGWLHMVKKDSQGVVTAVASVNFNQFGGINNTLRSAYLSFNLFLYPGDEIYFGLQISGNAANTPALNVTGGYFRNSVINNGLAEGDTVDMSGAVPEKIKQKDLFMSIVKMFNLYIETDKIYTKKLYIEPRDDFYTLGVNRDWTLKLDGSQNLEITPMGELDARRFKYTYTEDKDYYNELYQKNYLEPYGTRTVDVTNDFLTATKETKLIFSPTPLVGDSSTDRIIPKIYSTDNTGNIEPKESNIRILYYGGVKNTVNSWYYITTAATFSETTYPYAGHLDDPLNPAIDLSFAVPREVYYSTTKYTNNNLYNAYHRKFLIEIIDKDSKIVSGMFYLTPLDMYLLDFRDTFYVKGVPYRLNKIYDYNPTGNQLTKCEFLKIKYANTFVSETLTRNGGVNEAFAAQDNITD